MSRPDVLVVGGGLAGITAALECADRGLETVLVERRPRLGGLTAYSMQRGGLWIDNGQHVFLRCCTHYRGLLDRLGVRGQVAPAGAAEHPGPVAPGGAPVRALRRERPARRRLHLAPALLRLPADCRRPTGCAPPAAALALRRVDPADPAHDAALLRRLAGRATGSRPRRSTALWDLIGRPTLNRPPPGVAGPGRHGLPHRPARRRRRRRHRLGAGAAAASCTARAGAGRARGRGRRRPHRRPGRRCGDDPTGCGAHRARGRRRPDRADRRPGGARRAAAAAERLVPAEPCSLAPGWAAGWAPRRSSTCTSSTTGRCSTCRSLAAVDSPVQWVFDRTAPRAADAGPVPRGVALGRRRRVDRLAGRASSASGRRRRCRAASRRPRARCRGACFVTRDRRRRSAPPGTGALRPPGRRAARRSASPGRGRPPVGRTPWRARCAAGAPPPTACSETVRAAAHPRARWPSMADDEVAQRADRTVPAERTPAAAVEHLLSLARTPRGWWKGELETNVTMDAEDLLLREFLGIREPTRPTARARLDPLASSATTAPGPTSTAARPTCRRRSRPTSRCAWPATTPTPRTCGGAAAFIRDARRARARARVHPHLAGAVRRCGRGTRCRRCRRRSILLPPWVPLNVYDFACWARQTIVALSHRRRPPAGAPAARSALDELRPGPSHRRRRRRARSAQRGFAALDRVLHALRAPPARAAAPAGARAAPSAGSSTARRPTARGAASSRRGCTR